MAAYLLPSLLHNHFDSVLQPAHRLRTLLLIALPCIFFFCAGLLLIPHLGIENDEALFAQGLYQPRAELFFIQIGRSRIPIMLMSYVGALKSWIYGPILRIFGISLMTLRVPMLLTATASIVCFFFLLRRIAGDLAAAMGTVLLATDAQYLLTACFDWGPVALQHLLLIGGALLVVHFNHQRRPAFLAAGFFLFGAALWDKALAVWILSGLAVGGLVTFPRQIAALFTPRRAAMATGALLLGALPLVIFNASSRGGTLSGNFQKDIRDVPGKAAFLVRTFGGSGLFGWMSAEDSQTPRPHVPDTAIERASAGISARFGHPRQSLLFWALLLATVLAPFTGWVNFRLVLWCWIAMAVAWVQMAINRETGGSIHHTILLWPLPQAIIALAFAGIARRIGGAAGPAVVALTAVVAVSGILVINEYFAEISRNGGGQAWDDAVFAVARYFDRAPAYDHAYAMDWGIMEPLRLLRRGRVRVASGTDQISDAVLTAQDEADLQSMISDPRNLFIAHTPEQEVFKGSNRKMLAYAAAHGMAPAVLARIPDSYGRNVFEIYRFVPAQAGAR